MSDAQKNMAEARQKRNEILKRGTMTQADFEKEFLAQGDSPGTARYKAERSAILAPTESKTRANLITRYLNETEGEIPQDLWLKDRQAEGLVKKRGEKIARGAIQNKMKDDAAKAEEAKIKAQNEEMKRREESVFGKIVGGLTKIADVGVDVLKPVIPAVGEAQKAFAPPDSKQAKEGTIADKAKEAIVKKVKSKL